MCNPFTHARMRSEEMVFQLNVKQVSFSIADLEMM